MTEFPQPVYKVAILKAGNRRLARGIDICHQNPVCIIEAGAEILE